MQGRLFILSGCSGVGKDTILSKFIERNPDVKRSVSSTTRAPRPGEQSGVDYFFVSKDEFKKSADNDEFLEWAEFSGNYYGTKKNFVEETLSKGLDLILKIEVQGAKQVKEKINKAKTIFILPPSLEELEKRLRGRQTDSEDAVRKRMQIAAKEIEAGKNFDYTIVNDKIESALEKLQRIFDGK